MAKFTVVFVHGWSVTSLDTYGNLPDRLRVEGNKAGVEIEVKEIFLGRYISFHDEVRLPDISRAFRTAIDETVTAANFICITHSTGGPVARDWWKRYGRKSKSRMSHLIMLAPANFGSALAQLGKGTISRLKSKWFDGVEPGQGVLDWLSLGSAEAWALNKEWILNDSVLSGPSSYFPFVLTGQSIDRKFYDTLNSYTGETGSDGVVRSAAANLNSIYIKLEQGIIKSNNNISTVIGELKADPPVPSSPIPFRIISGKAHSGKEMGIMFSVGKDDAESMETINAVLDCINVKTESDYQSVLAKFHVETMEVQEKEKIEEEDRFLLSKRYFIHDHYSMIIFRVTDSEGYPVNDYDLILTAGKNNDPNALPEGFFIDRQQNKSNRNIITYFIDYDVMEGSDPVITADGKVLRPKTDGIDMLGIKLIPRPADGFVKYRECVYNASKDLFTQAINPNSTTMIDIIVHRIVDKEVFRLEGLNSPKDFKSSKPKGEIVD